MEPGSVLLARRLDELSRTVELEFLTLYASDEAAGATRSLVEYLALFAGHEDTIASALLSARRSRERVVGSTVADSARRVGPFELVRELGRGGQGTVWLANDTRLGRAVALKLVPRSPLFADLAPRFEREARAASRLDHPSLCAVYEIGADESTAWIAMRYVEGETLASRIARGAAGPLDERLKLLEHAARALHVAHESGIVHRDVKPANVMVSTRGEPVILDFGIARDDESGAPLTLTGDALGTPAYMAPEELRGGARHADRRADVWSLGVTAFETLCERRPFAEATREQLVRAILEREAPDARTVKPQLPRDLAVVLATALEKDIARRYQTALDFAEDLRRVREHEPIRARAAGPALRVRRWAQRNPWLAVSLASTFVVLSVALAVTVKLLADKAAAIRDVAQLSDQSVAAELIAEERALWPAREETLPAIDAWLARAGELVQGRERNQAARATLALRTDLDPDPLKNAAARAWFGEQLENLLRALDELAALTDKVRARRELAATLRSRSIDAFRGEWERAAQNVAADARFMGLALAPQTGLVPLGPDPRTKLEEFAVLESGSLPERAIDGTLAMRGASAIVLVLLPPGAFDLGCELPSAAKPVGSPNVDPHCGRWDGPILHVALNAFFIGKYELTQGQWLRHTGVNPSLYQGRHSMVSVEDPLRHPLEGVDHAELARGARELGLSLPTEAQWEYATRAGTTSVWPTGDDPASLQGYCNLADRFAKANSDSVNWDFTDLIDDGFVAHAPVGSLAPNRFGLHDTLGNVAEWCLDTWEDYSKVEPRAGDGFFAGNESTSVVRGGTFADDVLALRSAGRRGFPPNLAAHDWGGRVARALE